MIIQEHNRDFTDASKNTPEHLSREDKLKSLYYMLKDDENTHYGVFSSHISDDIRLSIIESLTRELNIDHIYWKCNICLLDQPYGTLMYHCGLCKDYNQCEWCQNNNYHEHKLIKIDCVKVYSEEEE